MDKKSKKNRIANLGDYGKEGGPGRPPGSKNHDGLQAVLTMLKDLVSREDNIKKIETAMQEALDKQPLGFYYKFVMPMLPKTVDLAGSEGGIMYIIPERIVPKKNNNAK